MLFDASIKHDGASIHDGGQNTWSGKGLSLLICMYSGYYLLKGLTKEYILSHRCISMQLYMYLEGEENNSIMLHNLSIWGADWES